VKLEKRGEGFEFLLRRREKDLLLYILGLYPRTPPGHHRLTETVASSDLESTLRLLNESIEVGRNEARQKIEKWLAETDRFAPSEKGVRLKINADEIEWLMQVLNEVRVGSWIRLGAPQEEISFTKINHENAADFGIMNMSGLFVMHLLEAIGGRM
jgi:hypothetical protein